MLIASSRCGSVLTIISNSGKVDRPLRAQAALAAQAGSSAGTSTREDSDAPPSYGQYYHR